MEFHFNWALCIGVAVVVIILVAMAYFLCRDADGTPLREAEFDDTEVDEYEKEQGYVGHMPVARHYDEMPGGMAETAYPFPEQDVHPFPEDEPLLKMDLSSVQPFPEEEVRAGMITSDKVQAVAQVASAVGAVAALKASDAKPFPEADVFPFDESVGEPCPPDMEDVEIRGLTQEAIDQVQKDPGAAVQAIRELAQVQPVAAEAAAEAAGGDAVVADGTVAEVAAPDVGQVSDEATDVTKLRRKIDNLQAQLRRRDAALATAKKHYKKLQMAFTALQKKNEALKAKKK